MSYFLFVGNVDICFYSCTHCPQQWIFAFLAYLLKLAFVYNVRNVHTQKKLVACNIFPTILLWLLL